MGGAILFIVTLAAWAVVTAYLLAVAARTYMVVVQGTVAGVDRVEWPDEPFFDWILTAVYFIGLLALILTPAGILGRALAQKLYPDDRALRFLVLAGPLLWLFFPVAFLSSMSASSRWVVLSSRLLLGLLRIAPTVIVFYAVTGIMMAFAGALGYVGLFTPHWYVMFFAVLAMSALWMIHARLVGRLGWLVLQQSQAQPKRKGGDKARQPRRKRAKSPDAEDPWADPVEEEPPPVRSGSMAYQVVEVEEPPPPRPNYLDPPPDPYAVSDPADEPEPVPRESHPVSDERVEREMALRRREPPNPPPASPLWSGVYEFPLYENCRVPLAHLLLWGGLSGVMFRTLMMMFPS